MHRTNPDLRRLPARRRTCSRARNRNAASDTFISRRSGRHGSTNRTLERENPSFGALVAEVGEPMLLAAVVTFLLMPPGIGLLLAAVLIVVVLFLAVAVILSGPAFVLFVVRSVNRRDDPRQTKRPADSA